MEFGTDEIYDGQDVVAPGAATAEAQFAAHQVTFIAAPLAQETFIASWAFVHGLGDELTLTTQNLGEVSERGPVRLVMTESERALAAVRAAIGAAALHWKGPAAHRTRPQLELTIVTPIVTHGDRAHAPTACACTGARVSSRTK
jgi:hypothetical protein